MIDRHAVQALVQSGLSTKEIAAQMGISLRSVQRIAKDPPVEEPDDRRAPAAILLPATHRYGDQLGIFGYAALSDAESAVRSGIAAAGQRRPNRRAGAAHRLWCVRCKSL